MAKKKVKRTGQITLRIPPAFHEELVTLAEILGLDLNGLIRLLMARSIQPIRMEARMLQLQAQEDENLLHTWRENHPGRPIREFWDEYWQHQKTKKQLQALEAFGQAFPGTDFDRGQAAQSGAAGEKPVSPKEEHS